MFTGIITDIGRIVSTAEAGDLAIRIACGYDPATIDIGASIACDGICLTVTDRGRAADGTPWFSVSASAETIARTTIRQGPRPWVAGRRLNLERALKVGDELGGHIVSGHVDGLAEVTATAPEGASLRMTLRAPEAAAPFIAPKGSIALDGTSLTVNGVSGCAFDVNLIPHTRQHTTWDAIGPGDLVNLEIDTMARYVARLAEFRAA